MFIEVLVKVYCSVKSCFNDLWLEADNPNGLCLNHYLAAQLLAKDKKDFDEKLKKNLERLKELEARIKARKEGRLD